MPETALELRVNRRGIAWVDGDDAHLSDYTSSLVQVGQDKEMEACPAPGGGKGGASEQAIGITKGGRNSKIHGLVDRLCRPWVLILTPGNTADCTVGPACVSLLDGIAEFAR
jgi:hypothetical protein